ncbi:type IV pilus modification PilV family protein [Oceanobacillus sp. CAU 1775]
MKRLFNRQEGMTLVEVLAAMTILGIVFVGFLTIFPRMTEVNLQTEKRLEVMNLARVELNELKQESGKSFILTEYGEPVDSLGDYDNEKRNIFTRTVVTNGKEYEYELIYYERAYYKAEVRNEDDSPVEGLDDLFLIHVLIKDGDQAISETFGLIPHEIVATTY